MADPRLTKNFMIQLGDGATPTEGFGHACGANVRSVKLTANIGEETTLDCDDPLGVPASIQRWVESRDTNISIAGRVALQSWETWRQWSDDATTKNIRIVIQEPLADGGGHWELPALLQELDFGTAGSSTMTFSATIVGAGQRIWTDAAA